MSVLLNEIKRFGQQAARRLERSLPSTSAPSNPGECPKNQTDDHPQEAKDADMSVLQEIKRDIPDAASTLERAGLRSDSKILSLTREDLPDLFPGAENFQLRRRVYEIIHGQKPIDVVLREMQQFIPHESLRAALTNNGVLVGYLQILKDIKTQVKNVQFFLDSHISLLESISNNQQDPEPNKGYNAGSLPSTSATSNPGECHKNQTDDHPQEAKGVSFPGTMETNKSKDTYLRGGGRPQRSQSTVTYEMVVCGKTFAAHLQLMNFVKSPVQDWLQFIESSKDSRVVVVFCPISSRIGSDVEAAMREVKVEKPVILVLMHHRRDPGSTNFGRTWDTPNVVLCVSVFYHETINGLVKCDENNAAADQIRKKLMEYRW